MVSESVAVLAKRRQAAENYSMTFDGSYISSGVYLLWNVWG
jgi:hypothetical protein